LLLIVATAWEAGWLNRFRKGAGSAAAGLLIVLLAAGCGAPQPRALDLNADLCAFCKMNVSDPRFAAQLVTAKGRTYMFDDIRCLRDYLADQSNAGHMAYVSDFCAPGQWVSAEAAILLESPAFQSPMGGNTAAFALRDSASVYQARHSATPATWP
jgi:copper chaperone NosL